MGPDIQHWHDPVTGTWTYLVADPSSRIAAVIDPVLDYDPRSGVISTGSVKTHASRGLKALHGRLTSTSEVPR